MKRNTIFILVTAMLCSVLFTGCGNTTDTTETTAEGPASSSEGSMTSSEASTDTNLMNDIGTAAEDLVDGAANAVDDIFGGFTDYNHAQGYFMNYFQNDTNAKDYELRDEVKEPVEYQNGNQGYHFKLYQSSDQNADMVGEFFLDTKTGKLYQKDQTSGAITEYKNGSENTTTGNTSNTDTNTNQ